MLPRWCYDKPWPFDALQGNMCALSATIRSETGLMQGLKLACLDCKKVSSVVTVAFSCHVIAAGEPWKTIQNFPSSKAPLQDITAFSCEPPLLWSNKLRHVHASCQSTRDNQISISTSTSTSFVQLIDLVPDIQLRILDRHWNADTRIILWHVLCT